VLTGQYKDREIFFDDRIILIPIRGFSNVAGILCATAASAKSPKIIPPESTYYLKLMDPLIDTAFIKENEKNHAPLKRMTERSAADSEVVTKTDYRQLAAYCHIDSDRWRIGKAAAASGTPAPSPHLPPAPGVDQDLTWPDLRHLRCSGWPLAWPTDSVPSIIA
jgi:hypothetical protein